MFRAAEADAFGTEGSRHHSIVGSVSVGAHLEALRRHAPGHDLGEALVELALAGLHAAIHQDLVDLGGVGAQLAREHLAGGAVHGDPVHAGLEFQVADHDHAPGLIDLHARGAADAGLAHAAGHHSRMAGHATPCGEDALSSDHAGDVFGAGLHAHQHHGALEGHLLSLVGGEGDASRGCAGSGVQALGEHAALLAEAVHLVGIEDRRQQLGEAVGVNAPQGGGTVYEAFVHQVEGDADARDGGALAIAGLEQVELPALNGELDVLHVLEVALQALAGGVQLGEGSGHRVLQAQQPRALRLFLSDGLWRADARDHVLSLGIDEVLAVEQALAGGRITGKGDTGAAVVAHVAEDHALHIHACAPLVGDAVELPVGDGAPSVPALKDGADGAPELFHGVLREGCPGLLTDDLLEGIHQDLPVASAQVGIEMDAQALLGALEFRFEEGVLHAEHHVAVHRDEAAVGIPSEARVPAGPLEGSNRFVIEAEVEDGVHHAGHGDPGTGANREQERILFSAKAAASLALEPAQCIDNLAPEGLGKRAAIHVIGAALLSGEGEPRRDRNAKARHFCKVAALASKEVTHRCVAFVAVATKGVHTLAHRSLQSERPVVPVYPEEMQNAPTFARWGHEGNPGCWVQQ